MYKQIRVGTTGEIDTKCIEKTVNGIKYYIPFDSENTDYQEFLKWKADGGVPEEAD